MKDFCHRCGRELNGTEDRCPECGSPTGFNGTDSASTPDRGNYTQRQSPAGSRPAISSRTVVLVAVIVICLLGMVLLPSLTNTDTTDKYRIEVTVEQISVTDSSSDHVYGSSIPTQIKIATEKSLGNSQTLGKWDGCATDGTVYSPSSKNQASFEYSGDLNNLTFYMFFNAVTKMDGEAIKSLDDIDIYTVTDISGSAPRYVGCSGVSFTYSDVHDGYITLKGDSDPIGMVKLKITAVKM